MKNTILPSLVLLLITGIPAIAAIRLVPNEYATIQAAIDDCNDGDVVIVAPGAYTGDGNRDIEFHGKAITVRSTEPNDPNIVAATIIDCDGTQDELHRGFKFHAGEGPNSVLAGLTITNGYGPEDPCIYGSTRSVGGAILCNNSHPTIRYCMVTNNFAKNGGAICCDNSSAVFTNCIIRGNTGYSSGGGIYCYNSAPALTNCILVDNSSGSGGGMSNYISNLNLTNCVFIGNSSQSEGGGMGNHRSHFNVTNCIFIGNSANWGGGAICDLFGSFTVSNCTITGNSAYSGGGIDCCCSGSENADPKINNSILWGNTADTGPQISFTYSSPLHLIVSYSDVEDGQAGVYVEPGGALNWGPGNIDTDPHFVAPASADYHLSLYSLCVNAGDPYYSPTAGETDIDGEPRIINGRVDIGPDEVDYEGSLIGLFPAKSFFDANEGDPNPELQTLSIRNAGTGTINWQISYDCNWLVIEPDGGTSTGQPEEVTLSVNAAGLKVGTYRCTVTIADPDVANSPQTFEVTLHIAGMKVHVPSEFSNIQAAIDDVLEGGTVLVADGIYTGEGNRDIDFKGKQITVRSENGPENCIIDCNGTKDEPHNGFYFHCGEERDSVLEGLTIKNGFAGTGGGICCHASSPTIRNCTISANSAYRGGGIACDYSDALLTGCRVLRNSIMAGTTRGARGLGGAIYCHEGSPTITDCQVADNAGIHCARTYATITDCRIMNNYNGVCVAGGQVKLMGCIVADNRNNGIECTDHGYVALENCVISANLGAGIASLHGDVAVSHCLIVGNRGLGKSGGGIYCRWSNLLTLNNSTIADNSSRRSGAIYCEGISCSITDCIVWNNRPLGNQIWMEYSTWGTAPYSCTLSYSNIHGGQAAVYVGPKCTLSWGPSNIDTDPCFIEAGYWDLNGTTYTTWDDFWVDGDYHLRSQAGRWDPNIQAWVQDDVTSPCIDAGDMASPIGLEPFPNGGIINMGAYGGTAEASKSYFGSPVCKTIVAGDINGDCKIDYLDFGIMAFHWLQEH